LPGLLPISSNIFRNLIPRLAGSFRLVAPDYPGFGRSSMPDRGSFAYRFETLTDIVEALVEQLGIDRVSLYVMDYRADRLPPRAAPPHPGARAHRSERHRLRRGPARILGPDQ
jgi:hypothetical protein